jgi:hypothetical protein
MCTVERTARKKALYGGTLGGFKCLHVPPCVPDADLAGVKRGLGLWITPVDHCSNVVLKH